MSVCSWQPWKGSTADRIRFEHEHRFRRSIGRSFLVSKPQLFILPSNGGLARLAARSPAQSGAIFLDPCVEKRMGMCQNGYPQNGWFPPGFHLNICKPTSKEGCPQNGGRRLATRQAVISDVLGVQSSQREARLSALTILMQTVVFCAWPEAQPGPSRAPSARSRWNVVE